MRWFVTALIAFAAISSAAAEPIYQQSESEVYCSILLYDFTVDAQQPVYIGDEVYFSFYVKNSGKEAVKIGKGGVYLRTSLGDSYKFYAGATLDPGKYIHVKSSFKTSSSGQLTLTPGICILTAKGEICQDFETSCSFDVFVRCPTEASCMTAEQASKGNYVQVSDEVCGYQISGLAAMIKTPMYCFREVYECPESCKCLTEYEAKKYGLVPCGGAKLRFCGYSDGKEMYCYQEDLPDLIVIDVWPLESTPGAYTELRAIIQNVGDGYAANSSLAFFVDGNYVGEVQASGLEAKVGNTVVSLPYRSSCSGSQDMFTVQADYRNEINESDENNNKKSRVYECPEAGMPDLKIVNARVEYKDYCRAVNYSNSSIIFEVVNVGNQTSPQTGGRIYIDGHWRGTFSVDQLQPGESTNFSINLQYMCTGSEDEIRIVVDAQNAIVESDEANNEVSLTTDCVITPTGADLAVSNVTSSVTGIIVTPDGRILPVKLAISYDVTNVGSGYSCYTNTGVYVDGVLTAKDSVPPLAPGETASRTFAWQYNMRRCTEPSDLIVVKVDVDNAVDEVDEGNNEESLSVECIEYPVLKPDLIVESVWVEGSGVSDLTIKFRVKNVGNAPSTETDAEVYVNYHKLVSLNLSALSPEESIILRYEHWTPQWERNRVTACVDASNTVDEIPNEQNNCRDDTFTYGMSCSDGVQNRDEEGVDCGGRYCIPCNRCDLTVLPPRFDWRDYYALPIIKDQNGCGSCWAHSAAGTVEASLIIHTGASSGIDLSEQFLMDCGPGGCGGGWPHKALSKIVDGGIPDEACFPYVHNDTSCNNKCSDWWKRVSGIIYRAKVRSSVSDVKRALICYGPLSVGSNNWRHALVLVGYDDHSQTCMNKYNKPGCWILKNSWGLFTGWTGKDDGKVWHEAGYAYIPYTGHRYSDIVNRVYYVIPADHAIHVDFEEGDGLAAGDVDGDGVAEIVHGDRDDRIAVYTLSSTLGGFTVDFEKWDELAAGDLNGDGRDEIVHADRDDEIHVYTVLGGFRMISSFTLDFEAGDDLEVGDVNGDGRDEIVHADRGDRMRILDINGNELSNFRVDFEDEDRICVGDVNGDGKDEIVHGDRGDRVVVYDMSGRKLSEFSLDFEGRDGLQCGDVNGDGRDEIVHADRGDWLAVYDISGALIKKMRMNFEKGDGFAVADVDGDGKDEIVHGDRGDSIHIINGDRWWS